MPTPKKPRATSRKPTKPPIPHDPAERPATMVAAVKIDAARRAEVGATLLCYASDLQSIDDEIAALRSRRAQSQAEHDRLAQIYARWIEERPVPVAYELRGTDLCAVRVDPDEQIPPGAPWVLASRPATPEDRTELLPFDRAQATGSETHDLPSSEALKAGGALTAILRRELGDRAAACIELAREACAGEEPTAAAIMAHVEDISEIQAETLAELVALDRAGVASSRGEAGEGKSGVSSDSSRQAFSRPMMCAECGYTCEALVSSGAPLECLQCGKPEVWAAAGTEEPARCNAIRGNTRCERETGHEGKHAARLDPVAPTAGSPRPMMVWVGGGAAWVGSAEEFAAAGMIPATSTGTEEAGRRGTILSVEADGSAVVEFPGEEPARENQGSDASCRAESPRGFLCTRDIGHDGEHEADAGLGDVVDRWVGEETSSAEHEPSLAVNKNQQAAVDFSDDPAELDLDSEPPPDVLAEIEADERRRERMERLAREATERAQEGAGPAGRVKGRGKTAKAQEGGKASGAHQAAVKAKLAAKRADRKGGRR